jgi:hypothetical protein
MDRPVSHQLQSKLLVAQEFLIEQQPVVEFLVMLGLYIKVQGSTFRYLLSTKRAKAAGYPYQLLVFHILVNLIVVSRYYILQLFGVPTPGRLDLALGLAQVVSSFYLAKKRAKGDVMYTAGFQTMTAMNLASVIMTFMADSPRWYRVMIKSFDWFTYFRLIITAIRSYQLAGYPKVPITASVHFISAPITLWVADYPWGIPIYFATLLCITYLNH